MTPPTGTGPPRAPVPPGWPGDDPTESEDLAVLGSRRRARHARSRARTARDQSPDRPGDAEDDAGRTGGAVAAAAGAGRDVDGDPEADDHARLEAQIRTDVQSGGDAADGGDDLVVGRQPAGRVLVLIVASLVLAMLVNADALVARAERQAPGRARDRALAVWHPVQDVSHALQLHRIRQVADRLVGDDDADDDDAQDPTPTTRDSRRGPAADGARETTASTAPDEAGAEAAPAAVELRAPTADDPLRLWVGGDSMAQVFGPALADAAGSTGLAAPSVHYEMASGLTRPDYFDWPGALQADLAADDPEVLVVVFGVNDAQGIVLDDGTPIPEVADPRWSEEYRRRVAAVMDDLRADDRLVLWVLLPPMRDPDYAARMAVVTQAVEAEAASRPWIVTVDAGASLADASGAFADTLPDPAGTPVDVRLGDGIHLTEDGADRLAAQVMEVLGSHVDLTAAPR